MTMTRSPRRLKQQVQDTVGEQVRDLLCTPSGWPCSASAAPCC
ncbi:hypothetical protein ACFQHO_29925 [Actinomadura yumaensis]